LLITTASDWSLRATIEHVLNLQLVLRFENTGKLGLQDDGARFFFCDIFAETAALRRCQMTSHIADDVLQATRLRRVNTPVAADLQQT